MSAGTLRGRRHLDHLLRDRLGRRRSRADLHQRRRLQELPGDRLDLLRHRRREEQRLPRLRRGARRCAGSAAGSPCRASDRLRRARAPAARRNRRAAAPSGRSGGRAWPRPCRRRAAAPGSADLHRRRRRSSRSGAAGGARRRGCSPQSATTSSRVGAITRTRMRRSGCATREPFEQRQHERRGLAGAGLRHADDVAARRE